MSLAIDYVLSEVGAEETSVAFDEQNVATFDDSATRGTNFVRNIFLQI